MIRKICTRIQVNFQVSLAPNIKRGNGETCTVRNLIWSSLKSKEGTKCEPLPHNIGLVWLICSNFCSRSVGPEQVKNHISYPKKIGESVRVRATPHAKFREMSGVFPFPRPPILPSEHRHLVIIFTRPQTTIQKTQNPTSPHQQQQP